MVATEDTIVVLCARKESEAEMAQGTIIFRVENVESETTDPLATGYTIRGTADRSRIFR